MLYNDQVIFLDEMLFSATRNIVLLFNVILTEQRTLTLGESITVQLDYSLSTYKIT